MKYKTIPAHFDGEKICLDEPVNLSKYDRLLVTVLTENDDDQRWHALALQGLSQAYGMNEPEYTMSCIREPNAEYKP